MKIEIREATLNDAQLLFNWANDPVTRQNSFNSKTIYWNDHILWLKKRLVDPANKIYILNSDDNPIGVVRFEGIENTIIAVTVAPGHRGMGLGAEIINRACNKFWESNNSDILAYVKKENVASLRAFEKAGFILIGNDIVNQGECLILKVEKNAYR
jgi:RimJ/RimL family protein N-acetyltransferase